MHSISLFCTGEIALFNDLGLIDMFSAIQNAEIVACILWWSEIILVISNETRAARSFEFEITLMISDQIALH